MTSPAQATTVRHEITVDAPIERAFSVLTEDFGAFKPPEPSGSSTASKRNRLECRSRGYVAVRNAEFSRTPVL